MKIKQEHYDFMLMAINIVKNEAPRLKRLIALDTRCKDPAMRLRWDLWCETRLSAWACTHLYHYANDEHIDTALRKIMKELGI